MKAVVPMPILKECPRCEKQVPVESVFCRRCGVRLALKRSAYRTGIAQPVRSPAAAPRVPAGGVMLVVIVLGVVLWQFYGTFTATGPIYLPPPGGYGGGGGGGPIVLPPNSPFGYGPNVQPTPGYPSDLYAPRPGQAPSDYPYSHTGRRSSRGATDYGPGRYGGPYVGGPYGSGPSGSSRGPGR
jgi:hypothetical protein